MTDVLLIVFVIAAVVIAGFALEKHSKRAKEELADELADEEPTPAPAPEVKQLVESQEEQSIPKPAKKRRRGRPAAKKD
jgi:sensor histidine kinase regulating citrate/malate metabolism